MNTLNYSFETLFEFAIPTKGAFKDCIGTVVFGDPSAPWRIANELGQELHSRGYNSLSEVVGLAHHN